MNGLVQPWVRSPGCFWLPTLSVDFIFLCKLGKLGIVQNTDKILSMRKLWSRFSHAAYVLLGKLGRSLAQPTPGCHQRLLVSSRKRIQGWTRHSGSAVQVKSLLKWEYAFKIWEWMSSERAVFHGVWVSIFYWQLLTRG